jgi:hypothetical protein
MNFSWIISIVASWALISTASVLGTPLRLKVEPKGTNAVQISLTPMVPGAIYGVMARTNGPDGHWLSFESGLIGPSNGTLVTTCPLGGPGELAGLRIDTLKYWTFVAGWDDDIFGDELPPLYKELVLRSDPFTDADPYASPMGDGWSILQKRQNNWDPLAGYQPPPPHLSVAFYGGTNPAQPGRAVLTIQNVSGVLPDYIEIEKAKRTLQQPAEDPRFQFRYPGPKYGGPRTNGFMPRMPYTNRPPSTDRLSYMNWRTNRPGFTNQPAFTNRGALRNGPSLTNRPAIGSRASPGQPPLNRPPFQRQATMAMGPFEPLARIATKPGVQTYTYVDTNVTAFLSPEYRCQAHYVPPFRSTLTQVDAESIRKSVLTVQAQPVTNGYDLLALHPFPYARYMLLMRDQREPQWRASGYFLSGTNRDPVRLHVDFKGMMTDGQAPIAMPAVKFLPDAVQPEFMAGSGDDSDGDGLPDVYEVFVTRTDPASPDTGNTGVLDGYKEMSGDGWSALEKFRRRLDPSKTYRPPQPVVLLQPTMAEVMRASALETDLHYEPQIEVRILGTAQFRVIQQGLWALYQMSDPRGVGQVRGNFDVRISWKIPRPRPYVHSSGP